MVAGERVFFGTMNGAVRALRAGDGTQVWSYDTGSAISASPAVAAGRLVIGDLDGVLYCFGSAGAAAEDGHE